MSSTTDNFWKNLKPKDALIYPYSPQNNCFPTIKDVYERDKSRLVVSLIQFAQMSLNDPKMTQSDIDRQTIASFLRICNNKIKTEDFEFFGMTLATKTSIIFGPNQHLQDKTVDWNLLQQAIFIHPMPHSTYSVFLVSLTTGLVDVFSVGDCGIPDLQVSAIELRALFGKKRPDLRLSFMNRLQVPLTFSPDPLLIAFLLAVQFHQHGKYLSLDRDKILSYKLTALSNLRSCHDNWLGKFHLGRVNREVYSFLSNGFGERDNLHELNDLGWHVIDVLGDGNCGFYVFLLGLENNGIHTYQFSNDKDWKKQVVLLRKNMRTRSKSLVAKYIKDNTQQVWINVSAIDPTEKAALSDSFFCDKMKDIDLFNGDLDDDYQMRAMWGPHVFASLFKIRVKMYMRNCSREEFTWTTNSWDPQSEDNQILFEQHLGICRLTDEEFKQKPTVEIVYLTGFNKKGKPVDNHFEFLQRVYCHNALPVEENTDDRSLMNILKEQIKTKKPVPDEQKVVDNRRQGNESDEISNEVPVDALVRSELKTPTEELDGRDGPSTSVQKPPDRLTQGIESEKQKSMQPQPDPEIIPEENLEGKSLPLESSNQTDAPLDFEAVVLDDRLSNASDNKQGGDNASSDDHMELEPPLNMALPAEPKDKEQVNANLEEQNVIAGPSARNHNVAGLGNERLEHEDMIMRDLQKQPENADQDKLGDKLGSVSQTQSEEKRSSSKVLNSNSQGKQSIYKGSRTTTNSPGRVSQPQSQKKRSSKVLHSNSQGKQSISKRSRTTRNSSSIDEHLDEDYFDNMYHAGALKHKTSARMKFDSVTEQYWICFVENGDFTKACELPRTDLDKYDKILTNEAKKRPNCWVGCSLGDPCNDNAPAHLKTTVRTIYQQHLQRFCLIYSLASALFYCEFHEGAKILASQAPKFDGLPQDVAMRKLREFMVNLVPTIGRPTIFNRKKNPLKNKKGQGGKVRRITWDTLFNEIVPHPTVIIPVGPDGTPTHAFCIVDDLIFDSTTPYALKLKKESVDWIYNDNETQIYEAYRFNMKCSPKGAIVEETYRRDVTLHWHDPSRVFIKRESSAWSLPHYDKQHP